jgi:hypothetical protein
MYFFVPPYFTLFVSPLMVECSQVFDPDNLGYIMASDLRHIMTTKGDRMTDEEVDEMIEDADLDKDGHIEYEGNEDAKETDAFNLIVKTRIA